ncbi:hypothetical protein OW763_03620 [Clostridium aestuarii]|uniref:Uncharacterized protein n=1 Tax=Clostridium aestuarii TaxID=338193 RepID=A0ABT4CWQ8_9CLOT|nr:hypothetical protein [Clostridium aestuarii]MCY6483446.1 hypothetical protein [Clostridium aestuarii]
MKKLNTKALTKLSLIVAVTLIGIGVFYGTYYFFISKSYTSYEKTIKAEITNINKINGSAYLFTKGQTIDDKKIISDTSSLTSSLNTSKEKLEKLTVPDKYNDDNKNLLLGLKNNISMYKQIAIICKNVESLKLDESLIDLQKYRDDCMNYYSLVSIRDIKMTLPNECLDFINNTTYFTQKQIRTNINTEISASQNRDFLNSFDNLLDKFNSINKNFLLDIKNARKNIDGLDAVLNSLDTYEDNLDNIKNTLSSLTIPNDATPLYKAFTVVLNDYDEYIQTLKYSVKTEKLTSINGVTDEKSLEKLYETPNEKFKTLNSDYKNLMKIYSEFENNV